MTEPRMNDKRIAEALERCEKAGELLNRITKTERVSQPLLDLQLLRVFQAYDCTDLVDALHDLRDARKRVAELRQLLHIARETIKHECPPLEKAHEGPCHPDAGCDGLCAAAASHDEWMYKIDQALGEKP